MINIAISMKELTKVYENAEEFEEEISGIRKLMWDLSTYSKNVEQIKNKMEVLFTHIKEELSRIEKLSSIEKETIDQFEKHGIKIEDTQIGVIYKGSLSIRESLKKIICILSLQIDVLNVVIEHLTNMLDDVKKFGYEKQKIETQIDVLKNTVEYLKNFMEQERNYRKQINEDERRIFLNMIEESNKNFSKMLEKMNDFIENVANLRHEDLAFIKNYEREILDLKDRLEYLENSISEIMQSRTTEAGQKRYANLYEAMKDIIFEKGITDKEMLIEELKRLGFENVTPRKLAAFGYAQLVEKYEREMQSIEESETESEEESE